MLFRRDPCGIICIFITYAAVFYADYVVVRWIALTAFYDSLWGSFHVILFNIVISFLSVAHMRAVLSDPGIVPLAQTRVDFSDYHQNLQQQKNILGNGTGGASGRGGGGGDDGSSSLEEHGNWTVCSRCESYRPPRAHHCRICKRCVRRMDHHCPWINNCVGECNQKYFMQFLFYVGVLSLYAMCLVVYTWINNGEDKTCVQCPKEDLLTKQNRVLHTVILMLESMLFGLFVVAIMIDQLTAILTDETAVEQAKKLGRHRSKKQPKLALLEEVCGPGPAIYWLLPCRIVTGPVSSSYKFGSHLDV